MLYSFLTRLVTFVARESNYQQVPRALDVGKTNCGRADRPVDHVPREDKEKMAEEMPASRTGRRWRCCQSDVREKTKDRRRHRQLSLNLRQLSLFFLQRDVSLKTCTMGESTTHRREEHQQLTFEEMLHLLLYFRVKGAASLDVVEADSQPPMQC